MGSMLNKAYNRKIHEQKQVCQFGSEFRNVRKNAEHFLNRFYLFLDVEPAETQAQVQGQAEEVSPVR